MSKVSWVCATGGQDFTRRCSANRHNNHIHYGNGIIVRFLEYVLGRTNGQFPPPANNNSSTRMIRKLWHNNDNSIPFTGNNYNNNNNNHNGLRSGGEGGFTTIPDLIGNALGCGTAVEPIRSNNMHKDLSKAPPYYVNPLLQSSSIPSDKQSHTKQSDPFEEFQERITKFAEIKILLTPYYPHQNICNILQILAVECING
jgi:hypothetical protein